MYDLGQAFENRNGSTKHEKEKHAYVSYKLDFDSLMCRALSVTNANRNLP